MTYSKTNWADNASPALSAANLNKIEAGIYDAHLTSTAINAAAYSSLAGDDTTDDTTALQSALNAAVGKVLYIPKAASKYKITAPLTLSAGTTVIMHKQCVIRQDTKWKQVFDVYDAPDVSILGGELRYEGSRLMDDEPGTLRREPGRDLFAGVWTNSHRTRINTRVYGMWVGVTVSGYDTTFGDWQNYHTQDVVIERLEVANVSKGILAGGFDRLKIGTLLAQLEDFPTAAGIPNGPWNAGHSLYVTPNFTDTGPFYSRGLDVELLEEYDSTVCRFAIQIGRIAGGTFGRLHLRNTQGVAAFGPETYDITIGEIFSYDDNCDSLVGAGSLNFGVPDNARITIGTAHIHCKTARRAVTPLGMDNTIDQLVVSQDASIDFAGRQAAVQGQDPAQEVRFTINSYNYIGRSSTFGSSAIHVQGTDFTLNQLQSVNAEFTCLIEPTAVNPKISYAPDRVTPNPASPQTRFAYITTYPTNPTLHLKPSRKAYSTTGGAAITPAMGDQTTVALSIDATNAFTINAVSNPCPGTDLTFELFNNAGGAVGTITWDTVYKFHDGGAAVTAPSAGNRKSVTFSFDGTNWIEKHRSG